MQRPRKAPSFIEKCMEELDKFDCKMGFIKRDKWGPNSISPTTSVGTTQKGIEEMSKKTKSKQKRLHRTTGNTPALKKVEVNREEKQQRTDFVYDPQIRRRIRRLMDEEKTNLRKASIEKDQLEYRRRSGGKDRPKSATSVSSSISRTSQRRQNGISPNVSEWRVQPEPYYKTQVMSKKQLQREKSYNRGVSLYDYPEYCLVDDLNSVRLEISNFENRINRTK